MDIFVRFAKYIGLKLKTYTQSQFTRLRPAFTYEFWRQRFNKIQNTDCKHLKLKDFKWLFKYTWRIFLFFLKVGVVFFTLIYLGVFGRMPSKKDLKAHQNYTASEVYSADGKLLGRYYIQDRTNVKYEDISEEVIKALVATEDARFYEHKGVDYRSLGRVLIKSLMLKDESSGGGSTISQQLAKNLYPRKDYGIFSTLINKLQEMIIARRIESVYNKKEVLELYLNTVPMGGNLFGVERASWRFFNKPAKSLKTQEAAVLIGMLKATTTYNPRIHPEKSLIRRNVVLNQMVKLQYLKPNESDSLKSIPLKLNYNYTTHSEGLAPYFREMLRLELVKWCANQTKKDGDAYNLYTDGLKIYTTIDSRIQTLAEKAMRKRMAILQKEFDEHWRGRTPWGKNSTLIKEAMFRSERYKKLKEQGKSEEEIKEIFRAPIPMQLFRWKGSIKKNISPMDSIKYYEKFLNSGLVSVEPKTGFVKAWVGGINHKVFKYDHVLSRRQVGSTFKPIVYASALEKGIAPCTYFPNQLISYPEYQNWGPRNADGVYGGEYSMRGALAHSINTISAQIIMQAGIDETVDLANRMGIKAKLPEVPSLALGVANISLFEMVSAYTTFVNEGYYIKPIYITKIVDRDGKVIRDEEPGFGKKAMSPDNARIMLSLMEGVVEEGSATRLRSEFGLSMSIAGKTGTTQDQTDGWFIGITPDLVTGVWVGGENPLVRFRTLALGQGSHMALPIWGEFIRQLTRTKSFKSFASNSFPPLPSYLSENLDCPSFRTEEPSEENFFEKVFNDIFNGGKTQQERQEEIARKEQEREKRWAAYRKAREERKRKKKERKRHRFW